MSETSKTKRRNITKVPVDLKITITASIADVTDTVKVSDYMSRTLRYRIKDFAVNPKHINIKTVCNNAALMFTASSTLGDKAAVSVLAEENAKIKQLLKTTDRYTLTVITTREVDKNTHTEKTVKSFIFS